MPPWASELLNVGVKFEEEDKSLLLLCSLPPSFAALVTTLLYGKETLEYGDMISVLRSNEQRMKLTKEGVPQEGLVVGERSERGRQRSKQRDGQSSEEKAKAGKMQGVISTIRFDTLKRIILN